MRPLTRAVAAAALLGAGLVSVPTADGGAAPRAYPIVNRVTIAEQPVAARADLTRSISTGTSTLRGTARAASRADANATGHPSTRTSVRAVMVRGTWYRPVGKVAAPPALRARAWMVADLDSGAVLGEHRARAPLPQASTIKVLTALTALRRVPAGVPVRATARAATITCSCAGVAGGRRYSRRMLLAGMLTASGNDAAETLAGGDRRGRGAFITAMNRLAARLGATDTVAKNPSGLDAPGAHSTARDLVVLLRAATQEPRVARWLDVRGVRFGAVRGRRHWLSTSTDFVHRHSQSYAAKNGYTDDAGNTLVTATRLHRYRIAVAVLGSPPGHTTTSAWALTQWAARHAEELAPISQLPRP